MEIFLAMHGGRVGGGEGRGMISHTKGLHRGKCSADKIVLNCV